MILFYPLKHHLLYIQSFIKKLTVESCDMTKELQRIGASQMDLYLGTLHVDELENELIYQLKGMGYLQLEAYQKWIKQGNGYRQIKISDGSEWVLRMGNMESHYVHLHPARYSKHTMRIKASTLKTIILLLANGIVDFNDLTIQQFNDYRKVLELSPIRGLADAKAIQKALPLFVIS